MNGKTLQNKPIYKTKDVSERCNLATPTVRKYAQALERNGFLFEYDGSSRLYSESDILVFHQMKKMSENTNMGIDMIAQIVIHKYQQSDTIQPVASTDSPSEPGETANGITQYDEQYAAFRQLIQHEVAAMIPTIKSEIRADLEAKYHSQFEATKLDTLDAVDQKIEQIREQWRKEREIAAAQESIDDILERRDQMLIDTMRALLEAKEADKKPWWRFW
jgi:DNA-binding transcriptional MerR regulator